MMSRSLCLSLLLMVGCGGGGLPSRPSTDFAERMGVEGIKNVGKMHNGLYRGAQPDDQGFRWLREQGFKTVINFRSFHDEEKEVREQGMMPVRMKIQAGITGSEPPTEEQIKEFFEIVQDQEKWPIYFHCAHGEERTGTMGALYRIEIDGWSNQKAIDEMQHFGYNDIYKDLIGFVREYKPRGYKKP